MPFTAARVDPEGTMRTEGRRSAERQRKGVKSPLTRSTEKCPELLDHCCTPRTNVVLEVKYIQIEKGKCSRPL